MSGLTHFDESGKAWMVDVSEKTETKREARAFGKITLNVDAYEAVRSGSVEKGDVLGVARVAAIMAVKKTSDIIPLCHPLPIASARVEFELDDAERSISVTCTVSTQAVTGVEMEALTGASAALLAVYDMCKALDKGMVISQICLLSKTGGKSGDYVRKEMP